MSNGETGLTIKELLLRLEGKVEGYIDAHSRRHEADQKADILARSDPKNSPAGMAIVTAISDLKGDLGTLAKIVASHERTNQRVIGAMILLTALSTGTLGLVVARIAGLVQ